MLRRVILDTNFLLSFEKVRIFSELDRICNFPYEVCILDRSLEELKGKKGEKLARDIIKKKNIKVIRTKGEGDVDDLLAKMEDKGVIVATRDKALKKRLKTPIITIRQDKYLILKEAKNVL
jgi:rRNA-processing protein FCF1